MRNASGDVRGWLHRSRRSMKLALKQRSVRWKMVLCAICLCISLLFLSAALFSTLFLEFFISESIKEFIVVDSMSHDRYDEWEDNTGEDAVPLYIDVYFWNLTNVEDIKTNSSIKPAFEQVGPFSYRKYYKKINVTFHDGGKQVSYDRWTYYVRAPDRSALPENTLITSVNSGYLATMESVGSESALTTALVPPSIAGLNATLVNEFARAIVAGRNVTTRLAALQDAIVSSIMSNDGISQDAALQKFCHEWATAPSVESNDWTSLGYLDQFSSDGPAIDDASALLLWNASLSSLVNSATSTLLEWDDPTPQERRDLIESFSLQDDAQLDQVLRWRMDFATREVIPSLVSLYGVDSLADVGYAQWGLGSVTGGVSVKDEYPELDLVAVPEIALFDANGTAITFDAARSKQLLRSFSSPTSVPTFLALYAAKRWDDINATFGLDEPEADLMDRYIAHVRGTFSSDTLSDALASGGGLFTTQTAFDWIWGYQDPLLKALRVPDPVVKVMENVSTIEEAEAHANVSTYHTGKGNTRKTAKYIEWRGVSALAAGTHWPVAVPIKGTSGFQFHPFIKEKDNVVFFSEDLMRPFAVGFSKQVTARDITLYRYHPIPEDFDPNPDFNQEIPGFANMTQTYGVPFFLSQPNFLNVPANVSSLIVGMNPTKKDDTYVDIEPITGTVMDASKKLQVNMYLKNESVPLNLYSADVPKGRFYPTLYIDETARISTNLANTFKSTVYTVVNVRIGLFWSFFLCGVLAAGASVLAAYLVVSGVRREMRALMEDHRVGITETTPVMENFEE